MSNASDSFSVQSSALTTWATRLRPANAPDHHNDRTHRPTLTHVTANRLLDNPGQPLSSKDFHLDTFFNPVWMSSPHVFSFTKDGTVVYPKTCRSELYSGHRASAASSLGPFSSAPSFIRKPGPRAMVIRDKSWKKVAITEQDDAECAEVETEVDTQAQLETRGKLTGLVHTWPPKPLAECTKCAISGESRQMSELVARPSSGTGRFTGNLGETKSELEATQVASGHAVAQGDNTGEGREVRKGQGCGGRRHARSLAHRAEGR